MGRGASVFVMEGGRNGGGGGSAHAAQDLQHLFGVLPTFGMEQGDHRGQFATPRRLRKTATAGWPGERGEGERTAGVTATMAVATLERTGTIGSQGRAAEAAAVAGQGRGRRLQEDCSSSCLRSDVDRCVNDPECVNGGIGCNAQGDLLCRFCSSSNGDEEGGEESVYAACRDPDDPTPAPVPTPSPTADPDREECDAPCNDNPDAEFPCFDDPSCGRDTDLLGCNAFGWTFCRFCSFEGALFDCPFSTATPAPTPAPSAGTTAVAGSPAPTAAPAGATSVPTAAATPAPSVANDTNVATPAPLTSTAAPTSAPAVVLSTAAPTTPAPTTPAPTTPAPSTPAPTTAAPTTSAPTAAPTGAPTSSPTASPTASPSVPPTGAPTAVPSAAPTVVVGGLGPGSVKGAISASGVPDELVEEKGEERLVQEVNYVDVLRLCVALRVAIGRSGR